MAVYANGISGNGVGYLVGTSVVTPPNPDIPADAAWIYEPPTVTEKYLFMDVYPVSRLVGRTVIREGAAYRTAYIATTAELAAADDYWLGGHIHYLDEATKTALEASGVGGTFTEL